MPRKNVFIVAEGIDPLPCDFQCSAVLDFAGLKDTLLNQSGEASLVVVVLPSLALVLFRVEEEVQRRRLQPVDHLAPSLVLGRNVSGAISALLKMIDQRDAPPVSVGREILLAEAAQRIL
jgi:hypothetical protein